jgi:GNAT superfamily N-acetyltransferase
MRAAACQDAGVAALTVDHFVPSRATAEDLADWSAIFAAGRAEASGGSVVEAAAVAGQLSADDEAGVVRWFARRSLGGPILAVAELRPQPHRAGLSFLRLYVTPPARRAGVGSTLLRPVLRGAAAAGYHRVQATVLAGPPGEPFARACPGLKVAMRLEVEEQRLDVPAVLRRCRELAGTKHPGYRLEHWRDAAPEPLVASFGQVMGHLLDAPGAMFQMAARHWETPEVRAWEKKMTATGRLVLVCAAIDRASGSVVAATVASVAASGGEVADQHDTAVLPTHRERGLARWIKADQAIQLHESFPAVTALVSTLNQQNHPMIAVNRTLGYRAISDRLLVEVPVPPPAPR